MFRTILFLGLSLFCFACLPKDPGISDQLIVLKADSIGGMVPKASGNGDLLLFTSTKDSLNKIWLMDTDGVNRENLYTTQNPICCISFSPSGKYIVFNESNPDLDIYRMNIDGTRRLGLTSNDIKDGGPVWTPDDNILFTSVENEKLETEGIYQINHDGTERIRLHSSEFTAFNPSISNNGEFVLGHHLEENGDINIYNWTVSSNEILQLTESDSTDWNPQWSPTDDQIVYMNNRYGSWDIYSVQPDGKGIRKLTDKISEDTTPSFSPCGKHIVYQSRKNGVDKFDIWVMKNDGSNKRRLTKDSFDNQNPTWSSDGSKIFYNSMVEGVPQIMRINFDGSEKTLLTSKGK